ncbi:transcription factor HES-2 [Ctenodactylus gundi]
MGVPRRAGDAAELRKSLKPLLEKRRRARINASLRQLEGLVVPPRGGQNARRSKLEKADILEMTVRFLRESRGAPRPASVPAPPDGYREGYRACVARLARVLPACGALEPWLRARLLEHLGRRAGCATPDGGPTRDPDGPPALAPRPAPARAPPAPPREPGLWRPW